MKALVTGGAGFIGSHVAELLVENGHSVVVVDNLSTGKKENLARDAKLYVTDITAPELKDVFRDERPDVVFHLAAQISVSRSVREPMEDAQINILGSIHLLELCVEFGVDKVVFSSSGGTIYGESPGEPLDENTAFDPFSPYGIGKMCFEYYLKFFQNEHDLKYTSLRYGNVYGPRQDPHGEAGVVAIFSKIMLGGDAPKINGDGKYERDYVYAADVARANLACVDKGHNCVYNVGTGVATDVNRVFELLRDAMGFEKPATYGPARAGDLRRSVLDPSLARKELGWEPLVDVEKGMSATVEYFRATMK